MFFYGYIIVYDNTITIREDIMGKTLAYKILENHLLAGKLVPGEEITIKIDQTLTQDSTGTMV